MAEQNLQARLKLTPADLDTKRTYQAQNLVIRCSDFYFRKFSERFVDTLPGETDEIVVPGVGLAFLDNDCATGLLKYAEVLKQLHEFDHVWFLFHSGCGAYKGFRDAGDRYVERAAQLEDMAAVERLMQGLGVRLHFAIKRVNHTFVPLEELAANLDSLDLEVKAIRADLTDRANLPRELFAA